MNQFSEPMLRWREVARRVLSVVMLLVGVMAVVATSSPSSELREEHEGLSFDVTPGAEVRLPFELEWSDAALGGGWAAFFDFSVVWRDVDPADRTLEISVVNPQGEMVVSDSGSDNLRLSCREKCIGGGEVVIRWRSGLDRGEGTVDWKAWAISTFDAANPPEGATIRFTISDPRVESESLVLATATLSTGNFPLGPPESVSRQRVEITSDDPNGEVWLEVPGFEAGYWPGAAFYVIVGDTMTRLEEGGSSPLLPPSGCGSPCVWSIELVLVDESFRYDNTAGVTWRLTQVGASRFATAESVDMPVSSMVAHLEGGPVTLTGDQQISVPVRLNLEPEAVAVADFEEHSPQVLLTLNAMVDEDATVFPDRARLEQQIGGLVNPHHEFIQGNSVPLYDNTFADRRPVTTPAKLDCADDVCWLEFQVGFETVDFGSGSVTLTWDLTAEFFYPFATSLPAGAGMNLDHK